MNSLRSVAVLLQAFGLNVMAEIKARHEKEEKYTYTAEILLIIGKSPVEVENILVSDGMDSTTSEQYYFIIIFLKLIHYHLLP